LLKSRTRAAIWRTETRFSALQRAEIAEMVIALVERLQPPVVSVLFNEPKLLK